MSAANELLTAIHARLTGDAELLVMIGDDGIRDRLVTGRKLPCVLNSSATTIRLRPREARSIWCRSKSASTWVGEGRRSWWPRVSTPCCRMWRSILERITSSACCISGRRAAGNRRTKLYDAELRFRAVTEPPLHSGAT